MCWSVVFSPGSHCTVLSKVPCAILPKKVQEYGDEHGYGSLSLDYSGDHLIIRGGGDTLMDLDINGTNNNEYIRDIVSYEWLD